MVVLVKLTWEQTVGPMPGSASTSGGTVIVDAQPRRIGGNAALIAGPSGAGIALQTWPVKQEAE